jgi:hypothetical protein
MAECAFVLGAFLEEVFPEGFIVDCSRNFATSAATRFGAPLKHGQYRYTHIYRPAGTIHAEKR